MPKNYFELAFCMCKGGNPNTLKMKIKQICGIILRVWHSAIHTIQFCFGLVHYIYIYVKNDQFSFFLFRENSLFPLLTFLQWKKPYSKLFSGIHFYLLTDFQIFVAFFKTFGMQNGDVVIFF